MYSPKNYKGIIMINETKKEAIKGAFYGAIVGDALCLGSHYEYDAQKIYKAYGDKPIDKFMSPGEMMGGTTHGIGWGERNYHPKKKAGGTTDYGDYNILILEHLADIANPKRDFDVSALLPHWVDRLENDWGSWICTMTRETYAQVKKNMNVRFLGGASNAMAIRHIGAYGYYDNEEEIAKVSRLAMFTHTNEEALSGAEFFARVAFRVINEDNESILTIIQDVAKISNDFIKNKVNQAIEKVKEAKDENQSLSKEKFKDDLAITSMARLWDVGRSEPIRVGKASPTEGTLPGAIYFILMYESEEDSINLALQANAMVGGDNASRAIAIGMVLGAKCGVSKIREDWLKSLDQYEYCKNLLNKLPLLH